MQYRGLSLSLTFDDLLLHLGHLLSHFAQNLLLQRLQLFARGPAAGGVPVHPGDVEIVLDRPEPLSRRLGTFRARVGGVGRTKFVAVPGGRGTLLEPPATTRIVLKEIELSFRYINCR